MKHASQCLGETFLHCGKFPKGERAVIQLTIANLGTNQLLNQRAYLCRSRLAQGARSALNGIGKADDPAFPRARAWPWIAKILFLDLWQIFRILKLPINLLHL